MATREDLQKALDQTQDALIDMGARPHDQNEADAWVRRRADLRLRLDRAKTALGQLSSPTKTLSRSLI